jgi:hypothetical protein
MKKFKVLSISTIAIFAVSLFSWLSFAPRNIQNTYADAQHDDDYIYQTVDYIQFDGASYIDTNEDQLGDIELKTDYVNLSTVGWIFGAGNNLATTKTDAIAVRILKNSQDDAQTDFHYGSTGPVVMGHSIQQNSTIVVGNNVAQLDSDDPVTISDSAPAIGYNVYLGAANTGGVATVGKFTGYIYSFQIYKSGILVRDFVPTARYQGCDENFTVEYGFVDRANDNKWHGNDGAGTLTGSSEITATVCETDNSDNNNPEDSDNSDDNTAKIGVPSAGF